MSGLGERVKHEVVELLPPAIFFLIAFHIITISRSLMLAEYGVSVSAMAGATIGALLVAKVVLIADHFSFINRFPEKPLIHNVVWKTAIYVCGALVVHYLEHLVSFWHREGNFTAANHALLSEVIWPHFWAVQLWLVVLLFVYCAFREFVRAVGGREVMRMFFGTAA